MSVGRHVTGGSVAMALALTVTSAMGLGLSAEAMAASKRTTAAPKAPQPADARANPLIQGNQSPPLPAGPLSCV